MTRKLSLAALALATFVSSGGVARAGVPFINLEGVGGIAFNPLAYPAGNAAEPIVAAGPVALAKPSVGAWYVNLDQAHIDWTTMGLATNLSGRLELSFGFESVAIQGAFNVHKKNAGAKLVVLDENAFGTAFLPAVAVGGIWKSTNIPRGAGTDPEGLDVYAVATKLVTQLPRPVLLSAGVLSTKGMVDGITGFQSKRKLVAFGNVDIVATDWLAIGAEVKQGPDYGAYRDALYYNVHAGWLVSKSLSLALAYTHAGKKQADPVGFGGGAVLGFQYAL